MPGFRAGQAPVGLRNRHSKMLTISRVFHRVATISAEIRIHAASG
jgi:hypothetical protein